MDRNNVFDARTLSMRDFSADLIATDANSFIHKKYVAGRPNSSLDSTPEGTRKALKRILAGLYEEAFFGVHIRETIHQFRTLFGRRR